MNLWYRSVVCVAWLWLVVAPQACGFGADYPESKPVSHPDTWPARLVELANSPSRVAGYFINQDDYLAFRGNTAGFLFLVESCVAMGEFGATTVHIHKGRGAFQPLDKEKKPLPCDWQLDIINQRWRSKESDSKGRMYSLELHVWPESGVDLDAIKLPGAVKVVRD